MSEAHASSGLAAAGPAPEPEGAVEPVTSSVALVLLAAALVAAALVALGIGGLVEVDDVVRTSGRSSERGLAAVPAEQAPAPRLAGTPAAVAFARDGAGLPPGLLGEWQEVSGTWRVEGGEAAAEPEARTPALAVVMPPPGSTAVQVRVVVPRPGAGLVAEQRPDGSGLRLVVASSGRAVELVRMTDGAEPIVLGTAPMQDPEAEVVLAIVRTGDRVEAYANGALVVRRVDRAPDESLPVGLVTGPGRAGAAARFDDLAVR